VNALVKFSKASLLVLVLCGSALSQSTPVISVNTFPGADASIQINACLAAFAAASGGTCDARTYSGLVIMSQQINVLPGTVLLLPQVAAWVWDLRDGVSAGIMQYNSSSIIGTATGGGGNSMLLLPGSNSTNMLALYATDGTPANGGSYTYASGFFAYNSQFPGATFAHGLVYTRFLYDESRFERIMAQNNYGDAWHIYAVCCDTEFVQIQAASSYGPQGGTPMTVEQATGRNSSSFSMTGTINSAGTGHPNLDVQDGNYQLDFPEIYMETNGTAADTSTAVVQVETSSASTPILRFRGGTANMASSKPCFSIPAAFSPLYGFENENWCGPKTSNSATLNSPTLNNATITSGNATLNSVSSSWFGYGALNTQNGQVGAGAISFSPTSVGWYRVFSGRYLQGSFDIRTSDPEQDIQGMVQQGWYGVPANITIYNTGLTWGLPRVITQVATSSNNADGAVYLDVYVADLSNPMPVSITFTGQGVAASGIVASPVVGSGPTVYSVATADMTGINSDSGGFPTLFSTGTIGASRFLGTFYTPRNSSDICRAGQAWDDANYHYVCVATDTIKRAALSSF
jgi:hypothetical protein